MHARCTFVLAVLCKYTKMLSLETCLLSLQRESSADFCGGRLCIHSKGLSSLSSNARPSFSIDSQNGVGWAGVEVASKPFGLTPLLNTGNGKKSLKLHSSSIFLPAACLPDPNLSPALPPPLYSLYKVLNLFHSWYCECTHH